jgi:hypothetical protein
MTEKRRNRFDLTVDETTGPFLFRTGCFIKHPDSTVVAPHKWTLPLCRMHDDLYFLFNVESGDTTLSTPYPDACIQLIDVPVNTKFVCKLDHVLGFSESMFPKGAWRVDTISVLTRQLRYTYFEGPGQLVVFGLGDTTVENISGESAHYDRGCVIGWDNSLAAGIASRSSSWSAFWSLEDIVLDYFEGDGRLLTQASTIGRLPRHFRTGKTQSSFLDKVNAFFGVRGV